jgi:cell fate regulator YaaT (PSP1 superfamily)
MTNTVPAKSKPDKSKKYMIVRYGRMASIGLFEHNETNIPRQESRVVVKTDKGLELGAIVGYHCPYRGGQFKFDTDQLKKYFDDSAIEVSTEPAGKFIRFATEEDISEDNHLQKIAKEELAFCQKTTDEMNLKMKIVAVEHIFGGERIIFYFMSDARVDFRELVKKLAHEYQSRIELRQIGARDEAKILGDIESCGQPCCCIRYLKTLKPVNMRMAKMQKATLDPSKISGYCGRLKCCLRYEDETYIDLKRKLPKKKTIVKTPQGRGRVIDGVILAQMVVVELEDGQIVSIPLSEIEIIEAPPKTSQDEETAGQATANETETTEPKENFKEDASGNNNINNRNQKDKAEGDKENP